MVLMNSGQWLEAGRPGEANGVSVMSVGERERSDGEMVVHGPDRAGDGNEGEGG